jgi:very-short-patch-repair endonuclease
MSEKTIDRHPRSGRWVRLHAGVYIPAEVRITWPERLSGALLACGPKAVGSHRSAARVFGWAEDLFVLEITVPAATRRTHPGILVHRRFELEAVGHDGFRVTNAMRTLVDLAGCVPSEHLGPMVDMAHRDGLIHPRRMTAYLSLPTNLTRPGTAALREIVAARSDEPNDSHFESVFFDVLRTYRVPLPVPQHKVMTRGGEKHIDYAYPHQIVAIELDGWEGHGTRAAFETDRARKNELERLGWHVFQFTWRQLRKDPVGVAVMVASALGLVPCRWR